MSETISAFFSRPVLIARADCLRMVGSAFRMLLKNSLLIEKDNDLL